MRKFRHRSKVSNARPLLLVGASPPPFNGQSVAFQILLDALKAGRPSPVLIDISPRSATGHRLLRPRTLSYVLPVLRYTWELFHSRPRVVYLTLAQSRQGFVRDAVFTWLAALWQVPIVGHLHGGNYHNFYRSQPRPLRWLVRTTLRQLDEIVVLANRLRPMFDFEPAVARRIHVVPNGVPASKASYPKRLSTDSGESLYLLFLSNLIESKGYFDVLEAARILRTQYHLKLKCDFCGAFLTNPSDDRRVRSARHARELFNDFVRKHDLFDSVTYRGVVSGDEKRRLLARAHFLLLPTSYDNEGQPISILEAMAIGCVPIATDYRGISEMIEDGRSGLLVPFAAPDVIATRIAELVNEPTRYAEMSANAIERVSQAFTQEEHVRNLRAVLHRVALASESAAPPLSETKLSR